MKKLFFPVVCILLSGCAVAQNAEKYANTILADDLKKHLSVIAHDSLEGRDTGSEGQRKAARYIINHFKTLGLKAIGDNGTYLQAVPLMRRGLSEAYFKIGDSKKENLKDFFLNGSGNISQESTIEVVYAGYGIESDTYNSYKDLDVKDKGVLILTGEPKGTNGNYLVSGTDKSSVWSLSSADLKKRDLARAKGAKFVLMVSDKSDEENEKTYSRMRSFAPRMNRMVFKDAKNPASAMIGITLTQKTAKEYLGTDNEGLKGFLAGNMNNIKPKALNIKVDFKEEDVNTSNVLGFLEGTDKKDEVLVISAHYDHIGISADGQINNGANDDGSGTVSIMELAEAFARAKAEGNGPRRSILFLTVTGEEKGLLGSEYYVNHPIIPIEKTVVDLNVDMVGRTDADHEGKADYIYIIGSDKLSSELHAIGEDMNKKHVNLDLDYRFNDPKDPNRFYYRSDHYNFAVKKIPIAFYFNGVHADYHKPTDDIEKIEFEKAAKAVRLVFYTAWEIANRDNRIVVDSNKP